MFVYFTELAYRENLSVFEWFSDPGWLPVILTDFLFFSATPAELVWFTYFSLQVILQFISLQELVSLSGFGFALSIRNIMFSPSCTLMRYPKKESVFESSSSL